MEENHQQTHVVLLLGQVAAGCCRKQHHHRGEQQESQRETIPLGGCRRYDGLVTCEKCLNAETPLKEMERSFETK